jgi:hypothetical protein
MDRRFTGRDHQEASVIFRSKDRWNKRINCSLNVVGAKRDVVASKPMPSSRFFFPTKKKGLSCNLQTRPKVCCPMSGVAASVKTPLSIIRFKQNAVLIELDPSR